MATATGGVQAAGGAMWLVDPVQARQQSEKQWALVSFVAPEGWGLNQRSDRLAMKIRGVFSSLDAAREFNQRLMQRGLCDADCFLVPLNHWAPLPPPVDKLDVRNSDGFIADVLAQSVAQREAELERQQEELEARLAAIRSPLAEEGATACAAASQEGEEA